MKKTILALHALIFVSWNSQAQISISQSDLPVISTFTNVSSGESAVFAYPKTGAAKTWDYSDFAPGDTTFVSIKAASSSSHSGAFPTATFVVENSGRDGSDGTEIFFNKGSKGLYVLGIDTSNHNIHFNRPQLYTPAPINYGDKIKDSSRIAIDSGNAFITYKIRKFTRETFQAVGYGSIKTPAGTFDNTLLIKEVQYTYDTTSIAFSTLDPQVSVVLDTAITYTWVQKDNTLPFVFDLDVNKAETAAISGSYYTKQVLLSVSKSESTFSRQYPIPADQQLTIELKKAQEGTVTLYDLNGRALRTDRTGLSDKMVLETASLPAGMYVYEIKSSTGTLIRNTMVVSH